MDKMTYAFYYNQVKAVLDDGYIETEPAVMTLIDSAYEEGRRLGYQEGYCDGEESWY